MADLISQDKCLFYKYPAHVLRDLRSLLSLKRKFKKIEHGFRVRIRNHLPAQYFPELDRYYEHSEPENLAKETLFARPQIPVLGHLEIIVNDCLQ